MANFDIAGFRSNGLVGGGARNSLFRVFLTAPGQPPSSNGNKSEFLVSAAELPEGQVAPIEVFYMGRAIKEQGNHTSFPDWTVTVMNDTDFALKIMMEKWQNGINMLEGNATRDEYMTNSRVDLRIEQLDRNERLLRAYTMVGAWPNRISSIPLDWSNSNSIEQFQVTFSYDYWLPIEAETNRSPDDYLDEVAN